MKLRNRLLAARCLVVVFMAVLALFASTSMQAAERQVLRGSVPRAVGESSVMGPLDRSTRLNVTIGLALRNQDELADLTKDLYDPKSSKFRQFISPEQFTERFSATQESYQQLIDHMKVKGLTVVRTHQNRMILEVSGAVPEIEGAFHLSMTRFKHMKRGNYYAPNQEPSVDIDVPLAGITGLNDFFLPQPANFRTSPLIRKRAAAYVRKARALGARPQLGLPMTGSGPTGALIGGDFRAAYAPGVAATGKGQIIGLVAFDGYFPDDVQRNFKAAGMPPVDIETVLLDGFSGAPGPHNNETMLDITMSAVMAPGAKLIVYEGKRPDSILNQAAVENRAKQISCSWTWGLQSPVIDLILNELAVQGQSFFVASGDYGAYSGAIPAPADSPNATIVGGTTLTTAGSGGAWQAEAAWSGSGGGVSTYNMRPNYQVGVDNGNNGASASKRSIPDVSAAAEQIYLIFNNGVEYVAGGTSAAAPLWAGLTALANQQAVENGKPTVGLINPAIYNISRGANYALAFHDINTGSNNGFHAVNGYDLVTGLGSPTGQFLIDQLSGVTISSFALSAAPASLSINAGSSGSSTITVGLQGGFNGRVNLTATGMPPGVTASFSVASTTGTSTLLLTASNSAVPGSYAITVQGISAGSPGALPNATKIALTIQAPGSYVLTPSPSNLTVNAGSTGFSTVFISPIGGFNSNVNLVASGLPTGVTATFSPASASTSSTLSFAVATSAIPGTYAIAIQGTPPTPYPAYISLTIKVPQPSFTLSIMPLSTVDIVAGNASARDIMISPMNGFNRSVNLVVSGIPSGVTTSFSHPTATSISTLYFQVSSSAKAGTYPITVQGTSPGTSQGTTGTLTSSATITLTIHAGPYFTIWPLLPNLSITAGNNGFSMIRIGGWNGFNSRVTLSVSGVPSGVAATFDSATVTSISKLSFAVASSAKAGTYPITIQGTSGTLTSSTTVTLTIKASK